MAKLYLFIYIGLYMLLHDNYHVTIVSLLGNIVLAKKRIIQKKIWYNGHYVKKKVILCFKVVFLKPEKSLYQMGAKVSSLSCSVGEEFWVQKVGHVG